MRCIFKSEVYKLQKKSNVYVLLWKCWYDINVPNSSISILCHFYLLCFLTFFTLKAKCFFLLCIRIRSVFEEFSQISSNKQETNLMCPKKIYITYICISFQFFTQGQNGKQNYNINFFLYFSNLDLANNA
jgi:maltodextrin utilization protein YvdJ